MKKVAAAFLVIYMILTAFPVTVNAEKITQEPKIIQTVYETEDIILADIVLTEAPYNADSTGKADCSDILQQAVDDCYTAGGGTVFLPVGRYRLTKGIIIRSFVTVCGDWQDPDEGTDYGTVIIADVESSDNITPALFKIGGSAGAIGLTVWYPNQTIDNVKPYPYTFYVNGLMLSTVKNCTMLNSYRGVGVSCEPNSTHEMFEAENIKGTFLSEGITVYDCSDVDTGKNIFISPGYWTEAGEKFNAPDKKELRKYTKKNTTGITLGDLEWPEYANINVGSCKYGLLFAQGERNKFTGSFFDLYITECQYGMYVPEGVVQNFGDDWGISVYNGHIEGSKKAVYDPGKNTTLLTNVKISGIVVGKHIHRQNGGTDKYVVDYNRRHAKPDSNLYIVNADTTGMTDASAAVQSVLDEAGKTGGVVYMPAGYYRFCNPVCIPAKVELRGVSGTPTRSQKGETKGTTVLAMYGYLDENPDAKPLITLNGENAGISEIKINFVKNVPCDESGKYKKTAPAVCAAADGCYAVNNCVILSSVGFEFKNCKNGLIKKNVGCCMESMISVDGCDDIYLEENLQNGNAVGRNGYADTDIPELQDWYRENNNWAYLFNPILKQNCDYLTFKDSKNVVSLNNFIYGAHRYLVSENTQSVVINGGSDGQRKDRYTLNISGGDTTVMNFQRSTDNSLRAWSIYETGNNAKIKFYNITSVYLVYFEHTKFENVSLSELTAKDFIPYILQPVFRLVTRVGVKKTMKDNVKKEPQIKEVFGDVFDY